MRTFTTVCCHWHDRWRKEFSCSVPIVMALLFLSSLFLTTQTYAQSLNLDQGANGAYTDPLSVRSPVKWQNGNLNQQQSHLIEGHSVPYRVIVSDLTPGSTYTITLGYDMVNSNKYALDFITGYDNLEPHTFTATGGHTEAEDIFPFGDGTSYVAPTDDMLINLPSYLTENAANNSAAPTGALSKVNNYWSNLPANAKKMAIWGGAFDDAYGLQYEYFENSSPISASQVLDLARGETKVQFTIKFTANAPQVTIAWGGHIASRLQWSYNSLGEPNSAGGLTGSPYHMRTITGGNQDRSLKVALAGPICPSELPVNAVSLCANSSYVNMPVGQCPNNVCVGTPLYFNIPVQAGALTYAWTVTKVGSSTVLASGNTAQFSFTPSSGGDYNIKVVLGNNSGFQATCSQIITVVTVEAFPASDTKCETAAGVGTAEFNLTNLEATVKGDQTGVTSVTWYKDAALSQLITTPGAYTSGSATVYAKVNKGDCYASAPVTLTVNPRPVSTQLGNVGLCAGAQGAGFTFGSNVTGTTYAWTSTVDVGFGTSGTGNINQFAAVNNGTTPITATVSVVGTAATCAGPAMTFTVTVNPQPTINTVSNQTLCSGSSTNAVSFSGAVTGTVFNWTNNTPGIGLAASGSGDIPSFTALNNTNEIVTATITVTPVYSNAGATCQGDSRQFTIKVYPSATVNEVVNRTYCNGETGAAINFGSNVADATFRWTSTTNVGFGTSGNGNIDAYTAINNTTSPVTSTVSVWASSNGCEGPVRTFTVTVLPTPTVEQPGNQTLCNGENTNLIDFTGTATAFNWTNNTPGIGLPANGSGDIAAFQAVNNGNVPVTATITVTPVYVMNGKTCSGASKTFTITVNPTATVNAISNAVYCNGDAGAAINFGSNVAGATFSWTSTANVGFGTSGNGNIGAYTATNNTNAPVTATITVRATANNCQGPSRTFTVTVLPTPTVGQPDNQVVCNSNMTSAINFTGTATAFNWTNNTPGIGLLASGSGNIGAFTAINTGVTPVTATITVTPVYVLEGKTCTGASKTFTITVNPTPTVNAVGNQVVCNGNMTSAISFSGTVAGTVFNWTNNTPGIGLLASGSGDIAAFTAVNTGNAPVTATITVTPSYSNGGRTCTGASKTFTITVNPTPTVDQPASQVVCNGAMTTTVNFSGTVAGTVYNWTNSNTNIGLAASGTGNIVAFTATNSTNTPISATITVTPSYTNGEVTCTGTSRMFTIIVNPTPTVDQPGNQTVCNGAWTSLVDFTGAVAGTVFNWTNSNTNIGLPANGSGDIAAFKATNTTNAPISATITVTPSYTNEGRTCTGTSKTFTITVNPTPTVNNVTDRTHCVGNAGAVISFGSNVSGATFRWTSTANVGFGTSGTGSIGAYTATNTTQTPVTATVSVWASAYSCEGPAETFLVTVNPNPVLVITNPPQTCMPNTVDLKASSVTAGSTLLGGTLSYWKDAAATMPLVNPEAVAVGGTYFIKVTTGAGCYDIEPVTVTIIQCTYCTYTQGAYGNAGGKACIGEPGTQLSTIGLIEHSLTAWNRNMRIGTSTRYVDIPYEQASKVILYLPGGGNSYSFAQKINGKPDHINGTIGNDNFQMRYTKKAGKNYRIDNTLLAQTITLGLNIGIRNDLDDLTLQGGKFLVTVDPKNGCGTTVAQTCTYDAATQTWIDPHTYYWMDAAVISAIEGPETVGGLFTLANRALGDYDGIAGTENGVSLTQIASVVDAINNAFDECKLMVGYYNTKSACQQVSDYYTVASSTVTERETLELSVDQLRVKASPNPFSDNVRFTIESPVSGQASLEVFNLIGQRLETVYQGYITAGKGQTVEYKVPMANRTTLIYVLKVGGQQVTGKLLNRK